MANIKISFSQVASMIPTCVDEKDVYQFINACNLACEYVEKECLPWLVKFINTKMTGKAFNVCRYRDTSSWENIKTILKNAFEQQLSAQMLQLRLNSVHMRDYEDVLSYTNRVRELHNN